MQDLAQLILHPQWEWHYNLNTEYTGSGTDDRSWYAAYEGTDEDEFVIATNADLYGFSTLTNIDDYAVTFTDETIYLCADIDLNKGKATKTEWDTTQTQEGASITDGTGTNYNWTPIGEIHWQNNPFAGVFDGQEHTVRGLILESGGARKAMFARVTGDICNIRIENSYVYQTTSSATGTYFTGSVVGRIDGTVCNVYSEAIVKSNAGDTLPDVILGFNFGHYTVNQYGEDGYFIDLTDYIEEYAPNYKNMLEKLDEDTLEYVTEKGKNTNDGAYYGMPRVLCESIDDLQSLIYINNNWLTALGLPIPTTLEQLKTTLQAFKTQDPNGNGQADEIPILGKDAVIGPYDYELTSRLIEYAKKAECDYAVDVFYRYATDGNAALKAGNNLRSGAFGMAVYGSHGMERTHVSGLENTTKLLLAYMLDI